MKRTFLIGATVALFATTCWAASNLNLSKSNINREFPRGSYVSASANIAGAVSQIVYRTPANADFILMQVCTGVVTGGTLIQAGGVNIAQVGSGLCQTFTPGIVLPPDEAVTCTTFAEDASTFCTIAGIVGPPTPTPRPTARP